jgi:hypothetical protein
LLARGTYKKYRHFTMIPSGWYRANLVVAVDLAPKQGCIIECGDGCARAVHDYLSSHKLADRIERSEGVCYMVKR